MTETNQRYRAILRTQRRRHRSIEWHNAEQALTETYEKDLKLIGLKHPELSPMERRVCALAKAILPNWKIGELLGISEKTVENHLRNTRRRLGLPSGTRMYDYLANLGSTLPENLALGTNQNFLHATL